VPLWTTHTTIIWINDGVNYYQNPHLVERSDDNNDNGDVEGGNDSGGGNGNYNNYTSFDTVPVDSGKFLAAAGDDDNDEYHPDDRHSLSLDVKGATANTNAKYAAVPQIIGEETRVEEED